MKGDNVLLYLLDTVFHFQKVLKLQKELSEYDFILINFHQMQLDGLAEIEIAHVRSLSVLC